MNDLSSASQLPLQTQAPALAQADILTPGQDIVIVEDDPKLADMLANYLQAHGFKPHVVADGALAVAAVHRIGPAVILLDVVLPNVNGIEICAALRRSSSAPIIIISARVEEIDRVLGLEVGADDYVCKPFSPREVLARVHAQLRRAQGRLVPTGGQGGAGTPGTPRAAGEPGARAHADAANGVPSLQSLQSLPHGFVVDDEQQRIRWLGQSLWLTPLEYRLFRLLLSRPGHVFSRERLLDVAHREHGDADISDRAIDSHIKNLRRKLHAAGTPTGLVRSVYGAGYRFEPPSAPNSSSATSASN
jgi:two-component system, OmpR family, response regulator BaeR